MATLLKKPEHFWPLLWGAACVALAGVLVLEHLFGQVDTGEGPAVRARVVEARLLPPFALPPEAQAGTETTSRPLFLPARRPAPPAAVADALVMKKGQFVLQGTTVVGSLSFAMLKEIATGKMHRVQKGGKVLNMSLADVSPTHAVLSLGGESETVPLLVARSSGAPAPAANAGPFAAPAAAAAAPMPTPAATPPRGAPAAPAGRPVRPAASAPALPAAQQSAAQAAASAADPATRVDPSSYPPNFFSAEDIVARRRAARSGQKTN
ncbi:MAG: hypothetical protein IPP91_09215 [Betaproteobacteria bacterium]|nr:hypothetical protein [Betaproteobacteria bacterium]